MAPGLPRRLAPVLPTTYSPRFLLLAKACPKASTWNSLVTLARIAKFPRLLHPVGLGPVSQCPSQGILSQGPYPSSAWWSCKAQALHPVKGSFTLHYTTNYLIGRRPIFRRRSFGERDFAVFLSLSGISLSFPRLFQS